MEELGGQTEGELIASFNRMLTDIATKYLESPAVQLEAIGAMRRQTAGGGKVPRGLHYGLSLVGAVRSKWYGGQGAVQSFVGYTSGLNSAHLMFSNDGNVPNQDGTDSSFAGSRSSTSTLPSEVVYGPERETRGARRVV